MESSIATTPEPDQSRSAVVESGAEREGTAYVVLRLEDRTSADGQRVWVEHDETVAPGKDEAIREVGGREGGKFKAVPVRNWAGGLELEPETITVMNSKPLEL